MPKPSTYLNWTDGSAQKVTEPTGGKKLLGWTASERPAFQYWNWQVWLTDQWIQYLDSLTTQLSGASGIAASNVGHHIAVGNTVQAQLDQLDAAMWGLGLQQAVPTGTVNGINDTFTLPFTPVNEASMIVFTDGVDDEETAEFKLVQVGAQWAVKYMAGSIPQPGQTPYVIAMTNGGLGGGSAGIAGAYNVTGSLAAPTIINPVSGIAATTSHRQLYFLASAGGAQAVTMNPQISAGSVVGQELLLIGTSDVNYISLADGNGLSLNGPINLKNNSAISLIWNGSVWSEISRR